MSDYLYDDDGKQLAWIANEQVYSAETNRRVATLRDWQLYSLKGEPLKLYVSEGGHVRGEGYLTPAAFRQLLKN